MKEDDRRLVAIRGATTVEEDTSGQIQERTAELLLEMMSRNQLAAEDIVSIIFTATTDLCSDFPAVAARNLGLSQTPLLCSQEIAVEGSIGNCIRVLMHSYSSSGHGEIKHPYLHGARQLRTDLPE